MSLLSIGSGLILLLRGKHFDKSHMFASEPRLAKEFVYFDTERKTPCC